jgi:tetratricopeptide (TPR) repeat protein
MQLGFLLASAWILGVQQQGAALESQGQWEQAAAIYRWALDRLPPEAPAGERFWLQTSLAELAFESRDYRKARGWLRDAEASTAGLPAESPERMRLLNAWGTLYLVEGNSSAAERSLTAALSMARTKADRAAALHNLAAAEMQTGRLREATSHEREAIELGEREFGDRHRFVMKAWIGLSSIQGLQSDWRAAEESLQRALAIAQTPEALANYAIVLEKLHRVREAKDLRRRFQLDIPAAAPLVDARSLAQDKTVDVRTR